jgi:hypothetical protein
MGFVFGTNATIVGASVNGLRPRIGQTFSIISEFFGTLILIIIRPVNFLEESMFGTLFLDVDLVVFFENRCIQNLQTFRTDALCLFDDLHSTSLPGNFGF